MRSGMKQRGSRGKYSRSEPDWAIYVRTVSTLTKVVAGENEMQARRPEPRRGKCRNEFLRVIFSASPFSAVAFQMIDLRQNRFNTDERIEQILLRAVGSIPTIHQVVLLLPVEEIRAGFAVELVVG